MVLELLLLRCGGPGVLVEGPFQVDTGPRPTSGLGAGRPSLLLTWSENGDSYEVQPGAPWADVFGTLTSDDAIKQLRS